MDASTPLAPRPSVLKKEPSTSSVRMPAVRKFTFKVSMTARDGACCALYARTFPFRHAALLLVPTSARRPFQASAFALSSVMRTIRRGIVPLRCARCRAWQGQCVGVQAKYLVCPVKGKSVACMLQTRRFALLAGRQTAALSGLAHSGNGFVPLRKAKGDGTRGKTRKMLSVRAAAVSLTC